MKQYYTKIYKGTKKVFLQKLEKSIEKESTALCGYGKPGNSNDSRPKKEYPETVDV